MGENRVNRFFYFYLLLTSASDEIFATGKVVNIFNSVFLQKARLLIIPTKQITQILRRDIH